MYEQCICCGQQLPGPRYRICGYDYWQCSGCGFTYVPQEFDRAHVDRVYGDNYFTEGGCGYSDYASERALLRSRGRYYGRILAPYAKGRRLLDVGCADGSISLGFSDEGWDVCGMEPNAFMAREACERGICALVSTLEEYESPRTFDAVAMIQVGGHFADIKRAMFNAAAATAPGGLWLFETWNVRSLTARAFGAQWHEFSPPSVLRIFTPLALTLFAAQFGFRPLKKGRPPKRLSAAHAKSLLAEKARTGGAVSAILHAALRWIPDRVSLPYPGDDVFWAVFEKGGPVGAT